MALGQLGQGLLGNLEAFAATEVTRALPQAAMARHPTLAFAARTAWVVERFRRWFRMQHTEKFIAPKERFQAVGIDLLRITYFCAPNWCGQCEGVSHGCQQ